jgi:hypothetical protein
MKYLATLLTLLSIVTGTTADYLSNLSVSPFGAMRSVNIGDRNDYGAGLDIGYKVNAYVNLHVRAIAYSNDDWKGGAIDEGSLLASASLLKSSDGGFQLSAIGGADRDFAADDWGFSVGLRPSFRLHKNVSVYGESRIRAWFEQEKDLITTAGLIFSF